MGFLPQRREALAVPSKATTRFVCYVQCTQFAARAVWWQPPTYWFSQHFSITGVGFAPIPQQDLTGLQVQFVPQLLRSPCCPRCSEELFHSSDLLQGRLSITGHWAPAKVLYCLSHAPIPFSRASSGLPQAALCLEVNVYLTALESLPHLRLLQETPLLSTKPQELTNSLGEEWDETLQPSFCLIYNPFMTKREYCIRRMQEVVQAKIFVFL